MTQYDKLARALTRKKGATTRELIEASGSVCPWKRVAEMISRGWVVTKRPVPGKTYHRYFGSKPQGL